MPYIIQDRNTFFYLATDGWCASPHSHRIRSFDTQEEAEAAKPDDNCSILPFRTRAMVTGPCYLYYRSRPYTTNNQFGLTRADDLVVFSDESAARTKVDELGLNQDEVTIIPQVTIPAQVIPSNPRLKSS